MIVWCVPGIGGHGLKPEDAYKSRGIACPIDEELLRSILKRMRDGTDADTPFEVVDHDVREAICHHSRRFDVGRPKTSAPQLTGEEVNAVHFAHRFDKALKDSKLRRILRRAPPREEHLAVLLFHLM